MGFWNFFSSSDFRYNQKPPVFSRGRASAGPQRRGWGVESVAFSCVSLYNIIFKPPDKLGVMAVNLRDGIFFRCRRLWVALTPLYWKLLSSRAVRFTVVCVPTQWLCVLFYRANPWKTWGAESCFPVVYTVVVCDHTEVMCVVLCGWPLIYMVLVNSGFADFTEWLCCWESLSTMWLCACWFSCSGLIFLGSGSVFQW